MLLMSINASSPNPPLRPPNRLRSDLATRVLASRSSEPPYAHALGSVEILFPYGDPCTVTPDGISNPRPPCAKPQARSMAFPKDFPAETEKFGRPAARHSREFSRALDKALILDQPAKILLVKPNA